MEQAILELLKKKRSGLSFHQLASALRLRGREQTKLRGRLKSMQKRGIILKKKDDYILPAEKGIVRGEFMSAQRGFGFVRPEGTEGEDVFIPARHTLGALNGDIVEILRKERGHKGKPEGSVIRILKKSRETLLGIYQERFGQPFFLPFEATSAEELPISSKSFFRPKPGMIVEVTRDKLALLDVLGMPDDPGVDARAVIKKYGLPVEFSAEAQAEAEKISRRISGKDRRGRKDYRDWTTVTIDGESAQDFDDAVSIRNLSPGRFLLGVHIADVSRYVPSGSALDKDALQRGTSVYFPDLTLPMLPEKLSNDICSLRPRKTRLTVSALLEVDGNGRVVKTAFHPSIIKTAERMTYTSVYKIFQGDEPEKQRYAALVPDLLLMRELAALLRSRREAEGSLNFDLLEPELVYKEGKLQAVAAFEANEAHQLIEEFMVAANVAVAQVLSRESHPAVYRVHPPPSVADLEELREMLAHFGFFLPEARNITSKDLQRVLKQAEGKPAEKFLNFQVLRSLRLAVYSAENTGHYGLAKKEYCHFTSPIRRYPDLAVHRSLKALLERKGHKLPGPAALALHASDRERKADGAEKELVEWRIFRLLKEKLGEEFEGIIVNITKAGVVVELEDYFVDGLIPYEDLDGDYYRRTSPQRLVGKRSRRIFELGEKVKVILAAVDPMGRRMTFVLSRERPGEQR